jgi:hypothetical protein
MELKKYMSLELGGKIRGLNFNWGTLKCLDGLIEGDPLEYKAESDKLADLTHYIIRITHAALLSNCLSKKESPDFNAEDVEIWVNELSGFEIEQIINHYNSILTPPKNYANGEVGADTQTANV